MKKLSRKWLILEHYVQTAEEVMDGVTVRLWKPKTMERLPAWYMRSVMTYQRFQFESCFYHEKKVVWITGNPDYGLFDAQTTICFDPHRKSIDIYICSLLMRPYSNEAFSHYEARMSLPAMDRLLLMWDSRTFDREGNYPVGRYGGITYSENSLKYEDIYRAINKENDIIDSSYVE